MGGSPRAWWALLQVLPSGETGELCVRGYSTMLGYWNDAQATAKSLTQVRPPCDGP